jgi:fatty-acyl-CoA synthase
MLEADVVGRPHEVYGEEPVAFVALRQAGATSTDELIEHRSSLARYKVARELGRTDASCPPL